jgi:serine/threonine protein phosphatase 1
VSTWVIGDVHGCAAELATMLRRIPPNESVVLLGDLYTKGPDPVGVWTLIQERRLRSVLGNHDARLAKQLTRTAPKKDPHAKAVIAALDVTGPHWRSHLLGLPLYIEVEGWTVVHASIHPSGDLERTERRDFLVRRRWPHDIPSNPRWWSIYEGTRKVVFGHDAARGLVRVQRDGEPLLLGLDTGCVYGGSLTAVRLPEATLLQVPAARAYEAIKR